jgi:hypothetical protein
MDELNLIPFDYINQFCDMPKPAKPPSLIEGEANVIAVYLVA